MKPTNVPRSFSFTLSKAGNPPNEAARNAGMRDSGNAAKKTERAMRFVNQRNALNASKSKAA